jgi:hypothetical protein
VAEFAVAHQGSSFATAGRFPLDVEGGLAPAYRTSHDYRFVMDLGSYQGKLTLGSGDGGISDNSADAYNINVWQVVRATPESILRGSVHASRSLLDPARITAEFTPNFGLSLSQAAIALGVDHFNWIQHVTPPNYWSYYKVASENLPNIHSKADVLQFGTRLDAPVLDPDTQNPAYRTLQVSTLADSICIDCLAIGVRR